MNEFGGNFPDFTYEHYMVFRISNIRWVKFTKRIGQLSGSARAHWDAQCPA